MASTESVNGHTNGVIPAVNGTSKSAIVTVDEFLQTSFDYLILGGGTAGCCIAARLSEDPDVTVGVIEAGKYKIGDPLIDTPGAFLQLYENPEYDWCIRTTPQKQNKGKVHHMPRGKVLGGSSAINYMLYARGSAQDYDDWAVLTGDEGWSAKTMNRYMRKHQTMEPFGENVTDLSTYPLVTEFHGTDGPIRTSFNEEKLAFEDKIIQACDETLGLTQKPEDPWSGDHIGFYNTLGAIIRTGPDKGKRSYSARGYIQPNEGRPNLKILCEARVNRINLNGSKAVGANITVEGQLYDIPVGREIIVCGGAIHSPHILELSGIGDPEILNAAGVECLIENKAVGTNLQDHTVTLLAQPVKPGVLTMDSLSQIPGALDAAMAQFGQTKNGPLAQAASMQGFLPFKRIASEQELESVVQSIKDIEPSSEFHKKQLELVIAHLHSDTSANLQLVTIPATLNEVDGMEHQSRIFPPASPDHPAEFALALCLQYPISRGYVHINSADPQKQPTVEPNYAGHIADITILAAFLRWADKALQNKCLADVVSTRRFPSPSVNLQDLEQAKASIHDYVVGEYHPCGSVALGAALDSDLRLRGSTNIRVADASVFPNHVSGNIVSSVYAVAERAADLIKKNRR